MTVVFSRGVKKSFFDARRAIQGWIVVEKSARTAFFQHSVRAARVNDKEGLPWTGR